jgi:membrane protein DedA with SNARE-associated domain
MIKAPIGTVLGAAILTAIVALPAFAMAPRPNSPTQYRGAPGPIAGAGLPVLAIGYGVYLLVRRRRRKAQ